MKYALFALLSVLPDFARACLDGQVKTTEVGATAVCDKSVFGANEAYRVPNGSIWTAVVNQDGTLQMLNFSEANKYCNSAGARLPSAKDWIQLYSVVGYSENYDPNCRTKSNCYYPYFKGTKQLFLRAFHTRENNEIWSSKRTSDGFVYTFSAGMGGYGGHVMSPSEKIAVVCVAH